MCEALGKNVFKFTPPSIDKKSIDKRAGENRIKKSYRTELCPVFKPTKAPERFARTENASKHSFGNMLFELLFGGP